MAIKGMKYRKAVAYLNDVLARKRAIPYRRHTGGKGRHAQGKNLKWAQCGWPKKSVESILSLLKNAESNAEVHRTQEAELLTF